MSEFMVQVLSTVCAGVLLTFFYFVFREKLAPIPNVNGKWYIRLHTLETVYRPYENMKLYYVMILWREGTAVRGTLEKYYEQSGEGSVAYEGANRTRGKISGFVEKNFFGSDKVFLHVEEEGQLRVSSYLCDLVVERPGLCSPRFQMKGTFDSMVAEQSGIASCQRKKFCV